MGKHRNEEGEFSDEELDLLWEDVISDEDPEDDGE